MYEITNAYGLLRAAFEYRKAVAVQKMQHSHWAKVAHTRPSDPAGYDLATIRFIAADNAMNKAQEALIDAALDEDTPGSATDLRHELAAILRLAADKADQWRKAAIREWEPLAPDDYYGDGEVTEEIEGPFIEHRLSMAVGDDLRRKADLLSAGFPVPGPLSKDKALEIATKAADAFIKREHAAGRFVPYDAEGRNAAAHAGLLALEEIEPGRWMVSAGDLDHGRMGRVFVALRGGPE